MKGKGNQQNITVKYKVGKDSFELLCKPGTIQPYRDGKMGLDKVLVADTVFTNANKLLRAKDAELKKAFSSTDQNECIKIILEKGTFSLTKKEMQEKVDQKTREILNYMHKYYYDASKKPPIPHPENRLESALKEMKYNVDPHEPVDRQIVIIDKKICDFLPIKRMLLPEAEAKEAQKEEAQAAANQRSKEKNKNKIDKSKGKKEKNWNN